VIATLRAFIGQAVTEVPEGCDAMVREEAERVFEEADRFQRAVILNGRIAHLPSVTPALAVHDPAPAPFTAHVWSFARVGEWR
jgi:hypothetical protein